MVLYEVVLVLAALVGVAMAIIGVRKQAAERRAGISRFGTSVLEGRTLRIVGTEYNVTQATHAEVTGSVQEGRRSTATRTAAGAVVGGVPGALVGHAAKKKTQ